jgi:formate-dependent nitrite reductase membrane component NrfD
MHVTTTRANPLIDPAMHVWGWEIPVYLFLGGIVAGMMVISGWFLFEGRHRNARSVCLVLPGLGIVLLSLGMLALFLDLEHKAFFWRLYTTFQITSPMSWGAWILLLVYPALLANLALRVPPWLRGLAPPLGAAADRIAAVRGIERMVGGANVAFGVMLGLYTGVLLSSLGARPLWNSPLLGPLFLASGLSAAAAYVHLIAPDREERELLARADNGFLSVELGLIALFFVGFASAARTHSGAAGLFFGGPYTAVFWVGVVGFGVVLPLFVQMLAVRHKVPHTPVAPLLVLAGGVALRFVIVSAGQASQWLQA